MTTVGALLSVLALLAPSARDELLRRGYELLPDARWQEELERDRASEFLGMTLPLPPRSSFTTIRLDFSALDYDRSELYPDGELIADLDLGLRANLNRWSRADTYFRGQLPSTAYQPPVDPLLPSK